MTVELENIVTAVEDNGQRSVLRLTAIRLPRVKISFLLLRDTKNIGDKKCDEKRETTNLDVYPQRKLPLRKEV